MNQRRVAAVLVALLLVTATAFVAGCAGNSTGAQEYEQQAPHEVLSPEQATQDDARDKGSEDTQTAEEEGSAMRIAIACNGIEVVYVLNDSPAARGFFEQLPLELEVQPFGSNEMTVYPRQELDVSDTPLAASGGRGALAYYEPWGDIVLFYGEFSENAGLYELGEAEAGAESIELMQGTVTISAL